MENFTLSIICSYVIHIVIYGIRLSSQAQKIMSKQDSEGQTIVCKTAVFLCIVSPAE